MDEQAFSEAVKPEHGQTALPASVRPAALPARLHACLKRRGRPPKLIRCDNTPEFFAQAPRDWCRFAGVSTGYIQPVDRRARSLEGLRHPAERSWIRVGDSGASESE
jgi:hypothetical protein